MASITKAVAIPHVVQGVLDAAVEVHHHRGSSEFATPRLHVDRLVWPRSEPLPAADVPVAEIIDVLAATRDVLRDDHGGHLGAALDLLCKTSPYERRILENSYTDLWRAFDPDRIRAAIAGEIGGPEVLDGWRTLPTGAGAVRAYPARIVHVLAGNAPGVSAVTIVRGALSKGVHLLKLPSNDLLTATAVLRALAAAAPGHPTVCSFSAAYWSGGDDEVEGALFRPQFFEKLMAWGGEEAIRNAVKYLGPGFELIAFDPKNSISLIGREAFDSDESIRSVAEAAALDATPYNQEACLASRFQFVEGSVEQADALCAELQRELGVERPLSSAVVDRPPQDVQDELAALATMEPMYRVFGQPDGRGLVIRSDEPVDFFPTGKVVNVVVVPSLEEALKHVNVSTQTVGVFPPDRKLRLRDALAAAGAQRIVSLGAATTSAAGMPHDGFFPLHRMMRWIGDEG